MNNFIRKYLDYTKEYESPTSFFFWSGVATIAATLRDNFYIQIGGDSKIFANMYVLFVAESGAYRKGKPVEISNKLVADVNNTKIISGRGSIQAILEELAHSETDKITGKMIKGGSAIFYAPELSAGIVEDPAAIKILTDIYDSRENYKSLLKSGSTRIENMVFSMLAASNEALLKETYNSQAIQGGLLARTFLVVPDEFRKSNALLDKKSNKEEYKELIRILTEISQLSGSAFIPEDAKKNIFIGMNHFVLAIKIKGMLRVSYLEYIREY